MWLMLHLIVICEASHSEYISLNCMWWNNEEEVKPSLFKTTQILHCKCPASRQKVIQNTHTYMHVYKIASHMNSQKLVCQFYFKWENNCS